MLLVLLHDFPEFLCDYHYGFCDVIPPNCIQMRNLILSAFPRNMRLPDPFTPNLKVDMLPEISIAPRMVTNFAGLIKPSFKKDLDSFLKNCDPVTFLSELRTDSCSASSVRPSVRFERVINKLSRNFTVLNRCQHNERLEFLGDALVEFVTSVHLFYMFPDLDEGGLAAYHAAMVQNQHKLCEFEKLSTMSPHK